MRPKGIAVILAALTGAVALHGNGRPTVGLVLSGGGAKGIAHIGVIQAFEENDIPIDYITGTSMGAIVGGLYASGFTPAEMIDMIKSPGFGYWSTGTIDPDDTYYFLRTPETPSFVTINLGKDSTSVTSVLPASLINPIPMNMAFPEIFDPYTAQCSGDFDRLFVPFRCVTSNVYAKHKVILGSGSLADAVRMSMSFPMVFEPIELDGVPMYDGGVYDNFPVDVMMEVFNPDALVGIDVGSKDAPPSTRNPVSQLEAMIQIPDNYPFPYDKGVRIRIDLDEFSLLDFGKYQEIYDIGYRRGLEMVDSVKMKVRSSVPSAQVGDRRARFKTATPQIRIDTVTVEGGTDKENRYLESLFVRKGKTVSTFPEAKDAYYRAISSGKLQNFVPYPVYNPTDSAFALHYKAVVKEDYNVGIGGYISSSTNSMLFFHGGYNSLGFKSLNADVNTWLGQSYMAAEGSFKFLFNTYSPSAYTARVVVSQQKYHETEKLFYQVSAPDFIHHSEAFLQTFYTIGPTLRTRFDAGIGFGHLTDSYHTGLSTSDPDDKIRGIFNLGQISLKWERNTLNSSTEPTEGTSIALGAMAVAGKYHHRDGNDNPAETTRSVHWLQADLGITHYISVSKLISIGGDIRALISSRKLLPTYDASIVAAPTIHPTPVTFSTFSSSLRANSFVTAGIMPVLKLSKSFAVRGSFNGFLPARKIERGSDGVSARYGRWLHDPEFFGEVDAALKLPFGTIAAYGNYATGGRGWNFGISIGTFILAPGFLD